jgi:GT2 family glycosyltransferase
VDLSAVIVNWNSGDYLAQLLDSLESFREALREVIVVDNGSTDSSRRAAAGRRWVVSLNNESNTGFAAAANQGIRSALGAYVALLNPDVRVGEPALRELCTALEQAPAAAIVCGTLVGEDGRPQHRFQIRNLPTLRSVISDALFLDELLELAGLGPNLTPAPGFVEQPAAAFWVLRKSVWERLGGFDENFFPAWFEDVDFCRRLRDQGHQILWLPDWEAIHRGGLSLDVMGYRHFVRVYYGNLLKYWRKHHGRTLPLVWLPVKLGVLARLAISGARRAGNWPRSG